MEDACDILEATAGRRAVKEGSDRLLMFLLKAHRREKYSDRTEIQHSGTGDKGELLVSFVNSNTKPDDV